MSRPRKRRSRGKQTIQLPRFPKRLIDETRCGNSIADANYVGWVSRTGSCYARSYHRHAPYSESKKQRDYLYTLAKHAGWRPPTQTCCVNQATALIVYLTYLQEKQRTEVSTPTVEAAGTPTT